MIISFRFLSIERDAGLKDISGRLNDPYRISLRLLPLGPGRIGEEYARQSSGEEYGVIHPLFQGLSAGRVRIGRKGGKVMCKMIGSLRGVTRYKSNLIAQNTFFMKLKPINIFKKPGPVGKKAENIKFRGICHKKFLPALGSMIYCARSKDGLVVDIFRSRRSPVFNRLPREKWKLD